MRDNETLPKKTLITPSTKAVPLAMYYNSMQNRIEQIGTLNFPQDNGRKLYGKLTVEIPVFYDGTIYEREGGIIIKQSSGNTTLDNAAKRIVQQSAPFGRFPPNMRAKYGQVWVLVAYLNFTREKGLSIR